MDRTLATNPLAGAGTVAAVAAEHATDTDVGLAPAVVDAIMTSGLCRLVSPTALGGAARDPAEIVPVVEAVSAADASAGWCLGVGLGTNYLSGYVPEVGARELFGELDRPGSAVFAPTGRAVRAAHGFDVTGRWAFASGCLHASVDIVGTMLMGRDGRPQLDATGLPMTRLAALPATAVQVRPTWDTVGLRATGSHDIEATGVAVPDDHTTTFLAVPWADDAIYRQPPFAILAPCLASVALGAGRHALDHAEQYVAAAHTNRRPGPKAAFGDDALAQADVGRAEVRLRAARALLVDTLHDGHERAARGDAAPRWHTALVGLACQEAVHAAVTAVDVAGRVEGSASVREGSPIEHLRRDIETMRHHVMFAPSVGAPLGRQLAGIPTVAFPFLLQPLAP